MKNKSKIVSMALCLGLLTTGAVGTLTLTGCAGNANTRSTGQYVDDKTTQHHVRSALGSNPEYKFDQVNVDVYRGTCQLSGFVDTQQQKDMAGNLAKGAQGVTSVDNNITVRSTGNQP